MFRHAQVLLDSTRSCLRDFSMAKIGFEMCYQILQVQYNICNLEQRSKNAALRYSATNSTTTKLFCRGFLTTNFYSSAKSGVNCVIT